MIECLRHASAAWLVPPFALLASCGGDEPMGAPVVIAPPPPVAAAGNWQLVWSDEFDGTAIDPARWNAIEDCWGGGNNERQCYTARPENIVLEGGVLALVAREEEYTGAAWPAHIAPTRPDPNEQATKPFTSARLTTRGHASWTYGRFEMRARLPQGQGVWPAFWMMPEDDAYGGWPLSGEIDIMEAVNLGVVCNECEAGGENSVLGTLHFGDLPPANVFRSREISLPAVLDGQFHTYGVIWEQGRFTWSVDGQPFGTMQASEWWTAASSDPQAPFDRRFHIIVNLAVGGNWPESTALGGVSTDGFPKRLEVDWVRVWQCDADSATGRGCSGGN